MENNTVKNQLQKKELSKELLKESSSKYELPDNLLKKITEIRQYLHKNPESPHKICLKYLPMDIGKYSSD